MSWYRTGTVAVTNGSKNVTGTGTLWASAVNVGDAFALVDANLNPTGAWYEVESVTSNWGLVLKQSYAGTTGSNKTYCVFNLVGNMTTPSFAQRLAQFFDSFQGLIDMPTTTPTASSIPVADGSGKLATGWLSAATASASGIVELATAAEAQAGTDAVRAVTPAGLLAAAINYGFHPSLTNVAPADLNTLLTPGIYTGPGVSGTSSWPSVSTKYGYVIVLRRSGIQVMQMVLYPSSTGVEFYIRAYTDGTWTAWNVFAPPTLAVTSTDNATSATAAPLKSAGGLGVAKSIWGGGPIHQSAGAATASRWVGEIPAATVTAVTLLSRSGSSGARPAILTCYLSAGSPAGVCSVVKVMLRPNLTHSIIEQYGDSGNAGGYDSIIFAWNGSNFQATKANPQFGCTLSLETINDINPWVSPNSTYFGV